MSKPLTMREIFNQGGAFLFDEFEPATEAMRSCLLKYAPGRSRVIDYTRCDQCGEFELFADLFPKHLYTGNGGFTGKVCKRCL